MAQFVRIVQIGAEAVLLVKRPQVDDSVRQVLLDRLRIADRLLDETPLFRVCLNQRDVDQLLDALDEEEMREARRICVAWKTADWTN